MPTILDLIVGGALGAACLLYLMVALVAPRRVWRDHDDGASDVTPSLR
jgi:hypothetical protein